MITFGQTQITFDYLRFELDEVDTFFEAIKPIAEAENKDSFHYDEEAQMLTIATCPQEITIVHKIVKYLTEKQGLQNDYHFFIRPGN